MKPRHAFGAVLWLWLLLPNAAAAVEIHVSPHGADDGDGSPERPVQTLVAAQRMARRSAGREAVRVMIHAGTYCLREPLVLTGEDSGTESAPVTYTSADAEPAILSGARELELAWAPYRDGIMQAPTPAELTMDQLFVNQRQEPMARYPNFDPKIPIYNGYAADAVSKERTAMWSHPAGGFIHAMHRLRWGGFHYLITGKAESGELAYEGGWQNNRQMGMHSEYRFVENIFEELDAPGEWYHDARQHVLYYLPRPDLDLAAARFEAVQLRSLIEFRGTPEQPVRFVTLSGLTLNRVARTFMETREPLLRSDWTIYRGGAAFLTGAVDCAIQDCNFDEAGGNAVFISGYNRRITIRGCLISDSGASGICFVGDPGAVRYALFEYGQRDTYDRIDLTSGPRTENYPAECLVEDCLIRRIGRVEKQTAGIHISMARRITVRHCSVYETPRAGINISEGVWGGHVIEHCDVFDTVLETSDHGSFNSWGRDRYWGLDSAPADQLARIARLDAIETTEIRHSRWRCDHGWDIDLDDGSSYYHIHHNLLLHGGLKFREGFLRIAENNVIVDNSFHPHVWYPNSEDTFRRNIIFAPYRPIRVTKPWGREMDFNLLHQLQASTPSPAIVLQEASGHDEHSISGDASFIAPSSGDYRVTPDSPARTLGFENFPMDHFGVVKPTLRSIARTPKLPRGETSAATLKGAAGRWAGAEVQELVGEEFSAFGVGREDGGLYVRVVPPDSPAGRAGLRAGDLMMKIDGKPIRELTQPPSDGRVHELEVVRDQQPLSIRLPAR